MHIPNVNEKEGLPKKISTEQKGIIQIDRRQNNNNLASTR